MARAVLSQPQIATQVLNNNISARLTRSRYSDVWPWTFTRASVAYYPDGTQVGNNIPRLDGTGIMVEEGTTNLLPAADSLSFAAPVNVTVVSGTKYTVSCATGEITLSGAGSGVVTSSTPVTITASTTTLTLTPTGTATYSQVE